MTRVTYLILVCALTRPNRQSFLRPHPLSFLFPPFSSNVPFVPLLFRLSKKFHLPLPPLSFRVGFAASPSPVLTPTLSLTVTTSPSGLLVVTLYSVEFRQNVTSVTMLVLGRSLPDHFCCHFVFTWCPNGFYFDFV